MITRESAVKFAAALGTTPGLWLNLQDSYLQQRRAPTFNTSGAPENPDGHA